MFASISYVPHTLTLAVGGGEFEDRGRNPLDGYIFFYSPDDAEPSRRLLVYQSDQVLGLPGQVRILAFSPDGKRVATGTDTGSGLTTDNYIKVGVRVLDVADGRVVGSPFDGSKQGRAGGIEYTSDGKYLITGHRGNRDSLIHLIDAKTARVADAVPAGGTVWDVTTSPRSSHFAAGIDKSIVVWSLPAQP